MSGQSTNKTPTKWRLKIGSLVNGPYTLEELERLASQGLLSPHSRIARDTSGEWQCAKSDPLVHHFFGPKSTQAETPSEPSTPPVSRSVRPSVKAQINGANFVIVMDLKREHNKDIEAALHDLGPASRLSSNCWVLRYQGTAGAVRNTLVPHLGSLDNMLVVDATRDKTAWFNFGPEVDAKVRQVWDKKLN